MFEKLTKKLYFKIQKNIQDTSNYSAQGSSVENTYTENSISNTSFPSITPNFSSMSLSFKANSQKNPFEHIKEQEHQKFANFEEFLQEPDGFVLVLHTTKHLIPENICSQNFRLENCSYKIKSFYFSNFDQFQRFLIQDLKFFHKAKYIIFDNVFSFLKFKSPKFEQKSLFKFLNLIRNQLRSCDSQKFQKIYFLEDLENFLSHPPNMKFSFLREDCLSVKFDRERTAVSEYSRLDFDGSIWGAKSARDGYSSRGKQSFFSNRASILSRNSRISNFSLIIIAEF